MPVRIEPATVADVPVILELIRGLAEYEKLAHTVIATEDALRQTLFGPRPAAEVLLAFDATEPVGFALFFPNYSTFLAKPGLYLEDLFVKPHARGQGIGLALLTRLAAIARDRDCGRMEWSVLDWNEPAIGFYKKLGAVLMNEWWIFRLTGDAIGKLASAEPPKLARRIPGIDKGKIWMADDAFDPLTEEELKEWYDGGSDDPLNQ
jgi:GNAT superfamily N-acetyltransferase